MLRISRLTDYGIMLLGIVARYPENSVHTAGDLARRSRLPLPTVSKILKTLAKRGILLSQRGAEGGYRLAQRPQELTVARVIAALERPISLTLCCEGPGNCMLDKTCLVEHGIQKINLAIGSALANIHLSELYAPGPQFLTLGHVPAVQGGGAL